MERSSIVHSSDPRKSQINDLGILLILRFTNNNNHQYAHLLTPPHGIVACTSQGSLRKPFQQQHSASSSSLLGRRVPNTGIGSISLVSNTITISIHPRIQLGGNFLVTTQRHLSNRQTLFNLVLFRYPHSTISHSTYRSNTGGSNYTTWQENST